MPISNSPTTRKLFTRGSVPAGVTVPCGVMTTTLSPTRAPSARASSAPSTMPKPSGLRSASAPARIWLPKSATVSSSAGSMPRTSAPRLTSPVESIAWPKTYGAAAWTRGFLRAACASDCQSATPPARPRISMCEATARMRVRNSSWKPFITDSTTMSAATPRAMPSIEEDGLVATACRSCGIAKQQDWPVAPWLARGAALDPGGAYWLCAEPARFIVGRADVRLGGMIDDLDEAETDALVAALNLHFADDGLRFFALHGPARWFARVEQAPRLVTRPPEVALGASLAPYLPTGPDAARWRRWQSEVQMLLFENPVNRGREQSGRVSVDSVWLWGGGTLIERDRPAVRIFANGGLIGELSRSAGLAPAALPAALDAAPSDVARVFWLDAIDVGVAAA